MTDMRRTLLWVVFTMSLVLLWDAWSRHNGQPTLFGGPVPAASAAASGNGVPTPASAAAKVPRRRGRRLGARGRPERDLHRPHRRDDGHLRHPGRHPAPRGAQVPERRRPKQPMLVLDETGHRYEAQTGYISAAPRRCPPT
jgi:YidC/Oxa1 family membrane protein insertase